MKPKPFVGLNHFTVPIAIAVALLCRKFAGGTLWLKRLSIHNRGPGAVDAVLLAGFVDLGGSSPRHSHRTASQSTSTSVYLPLTPCFHDSDALYAYVSDSLGRNCDGRKETPEAPSTPGSARCYHSEH